MGSNRKGSAVEIADQAGLRGHVAALLLRLTIGIDVGRGGTEALRRLVARLNL